MDNKKLTKSAVGKVSQNDIIQVSISIGNKVDVLDATIFKLLQCQRDRVNGRGDTVFVAKTQTTGTVDFHLGQNESGGSGRCRHRKCRHCSG
jgi:hypothetical protein